MYITDSEIEKHLKNSEYNYFHKEENKGKIVDTNLKISTGKVIKDDFKSVKIFMSKLSKRLFNHKLKIHNVEEIEVIREAEHLLHNKYNEIFGESNLLRLIEEDLIEKFL